jgi:hypothetical protein
MTIKIYRTIILLVVVLCVCEASSLTLVEGVREQGAAEGVWA